MAVPPRVSTAVPMSGVLRQAQLLLPWHLTVKLLYPGSAAEPRTSAWGPRGGFARNRPLAPQHRAHQRGSKGVIDARTGMPAGMAGGRYVRSKIR
jgi:hypothetical protein